MNWNRIVHEHGPLVFGTAWRILGHTADAEDVCQDVFLEAHRLRQGQPIRNWGGFLRRLAACRALDKLRQRKPTLPLEGVDLSDQRSALEDVVAERELRARLRQALTQLPEREGEVFCLRYFEDLSPQQVADALNISTGAVAAALHKARAKLEALLLESKNPV